ncbi:MAG: rhomboid family intramembrane serine protease [Archangiaceae bacterium]|nr:rhomboid family intramembrane serine protease [Archangiaceae bacterium]
MNPLDSLTAALLEVDRSLVVSARTERGVQLQAPPMRVTLADVLDLPTFEADVKAWSEAVKPGERAVIVAVDARRLGAEEVLDRLVPSALTQVRSVRMASVWVPGEAPKHVRGATWKSVDAAVKLVDAGGVADPAAVIARRAQQADEVSDFMAPLLQRKPVVTWAVAAVSVLLFGLQMLWGNGEPYVVAPRMGAAVPSLIFQGEVWRLLAPMLLHGSIAHLAMNMIALFGFGTFLERFLGWRRYLLLYVLAGLGGSIASALRPTDVVAVGASGGIWGLMVAGAVLVTWPRGKLPALVSQVQKQRAWTPVGINLLYSFTPGIDWLAHLGGGLVGGVLVFTGVILSGIPPAETSNDPLAPPLAERAPVKVGGLLALVALTAAVAVAFAFGRPWELASKPTPRAVAFGSGAVAQLPVLATAPKPQGNGSSWLYGTLQQDPVAFVMVFPEVKVSDEQLADLEGTLRATVAVFDPGLIDGFHVEVKSELRDRGGRPYLYHRQVAADGRAADSYFLIDGHRTATVMVLSSKAASSGWREVAAEAPFTLKLN